MTVIAAINASGHTWYGSDSLATTSRRRAICGPKWTTYGRWAAGAAGDLRTISLMAANAKRLFDDLPGAFEFTRRLRDILREDGYAPHKDSGAAPSLEQDIILACDTTVWEIDACFGIIEVPRGEMCAIGSGEEYALGAAMALRGKHRPDVIVRKAIEAAIYFDPACGGDVHIARLG